MPDQIKKISLLIFSVSYAGGCERFTCGMANELNKRGYDVSVINIYNENTSFFPLDKEIRIKGLFKKPKTPSKYRFPFIPFKVFNLLKNRNERPDILIGVGIDTSLYALLATRLLNIKFISLEQFNYNANMDKFLSRLGKRLSARYAEALVVLTTKDMDQFRQNLPVKGILACIPNFMTIQTASPSSVSSQIAIAIGRYTRQKGFDSLIKIWEQVSKRHPQWKLKIIGKGEDRTLLEQMITERNLQNSVSLIHVSDNVSQYYKEASVFLLSSRWEGLPLVTVEAKSFGLPIVSFDCDTGPRDVIQNGVDGILVSDQDIDAFAAAVNDLLANRSLLQQMGKQSLLNSRQFSAETVVPMWEKLFAEL